MSLSNFVVVDPDGKRGNALSRALSALGYAFPVAHLHEVGDAWPERCCLMVCDTGDLLAETGAFLHDRGLYNPVVAYAAGAPTARVVEVLRGGALSYVDWPCTDAALHRAIGAIGCTAEDILRSCEAGTRTERRLRQLTPRETEVLRIMSEGLATKELAHRLGISPRTAEIYRSNILRKLEVRNAIQAARVWWHAVHR